MLLSVMPILESALELHEKRLSIVPVVEKRPAIAWDIYTERHPTTSELRSWFTWKYSRFAIVTGLISGVVAVDCDGPAAIDFADQSLPATPMRSRTPHGEHRYYDCEEIIRNGVKLNGMPLDIRGEKGLCVEFGEGYDRVGDWNAPRPMFDLSWIRKDVEDALSIPSGDFESSTPSSLMSYIKHIESIAGQRGHDACFRCACKIADAGLGFEESMQVFTWWNSFCAFPQWSVGELNHKLTDAFKKKGR